MQGDRPTIGHGFKLMSAGDTFNEETRERRKYLHVLPFKKSLMRNTFSKYGKFGLRRSLETKLLTLAQKATSRVFQPARQL